MYSLFLCIVQLSCLSDGTSVKHRLQHAAQFCPCHIEGYEESGEKGLTAFNHKVLKKGICKKMRATRSLSKKLCKHGFEPVNLVNGVVVYEGEDFFFPGMLPKKEHFTPQRLPLIYEKIHIFNL